LVEAVRFDLEEHNRLYHIYKSFANFETEYEDAYIELADPGNGDEIAALYHVGNAPRPGPRSLYIQHASDAKAMHVPILSALYEPLQYPLLFPHATAGWGPYMRTLGWTQCTYYKARLLTEKRFQDFGRLGCEYICDMYSRIEDERLSYIQKGKAAEAKQFRDTAFDDEYDRDNDDDNDDDVHSFALPSSFTGLPCYYADKVADALALARQRGKPNLMITATCNPNWPELRAHLRPGQ
jgi:hypothetical protein